MIFASLGRKRVRWWRVSFVRDGALPEGIQLFAHARLTPSKGGSYTLAGQNAEA
ncbi:hypothetical protein BRCON_1705 [Candidatus Sumerlaea chitinivorans]|uniref:Uncharacterized protein n=1 Tax=Sumerlaea chitinivorans TaxID=2250252 RepID=A0A2Z4Y707_SUMC1|nr:hypothetical protein BRCON_1705 [Candidatus Sumerlaea chitinivorans]